MTPVLTGTSEATGTEATAPAVSVADRVGARALHMMGPDTALAEPGDAAIAWEGLLEVSRRLRRSAEELAGTR